MSQLDLFGAPGKPEAAGTQGNPRSAPKARSVPRGKPVPATFIRLHVCGRCSESFEGPDLRGIALCANCAGVGDAPDALPNVDLEERCIVIGCGCVSAGIEIAGRPVCELHNTSVTRGVMATGSWPAWYGYEGKWRVVPTVRRLDDLGHTWAGAVTSEKLCSSCGLRYLDWQRNRFVAPCANYQQPDTTKGLFRP